MHQVVRSLLGIWEDYREKKKKEESSSEFYPLLYSSAYKSI